MKGKFVCLLLSFSLLLFQGCDRVSAPLSSGQPASAMGFYLDTVVTMNAYGLEQEALQTILKSCASYEALLSRHVEGSDVWRINHSGGAAVKVSEDTVCILSVAQAIAEASDGAFDVTIAPASALPSACVSPLASAR